MGTILSYAKPYKFFVIFAWVFMLVELTVELSSPMIMAKVIDEGVVASELDKVIWWGGILLLISLLSFISGIINSFFSSHASQHFAYDLREAIFTKIQSIPFANLNHFPGSSLITRLTNDVIQIQNTFFISLRIAFRAPLLIVFGTVMSLYVHFKLGLLYVLAIPFLLFFLIWVMKKAAALFRSVQNRLDRVNGVMRENLSGIRLVKAFDNRHFEQNRFFQVNLGLKNSTVKALRFVEIGAPVLLFFMNTIIVLILWLGNIELNIGGAKPGEVIAIVNYGTRITHALSMLSWIIMSFSRAKASGDRLNEILELEGIEKESETEDCRIEKGMVLFQNVSFRYNNEGVMTLDSVNFHVKPGGSVAIIGATGSGKTTLLQLIPRLIEPDSGTIYIDGKDIRDISLKELRGAIGYVPQDSFLFTGTIIENICWGNRMATMEDIIQAAKDAQIHESILQFPKQYETKVGQKGVTLSGGQKQRIAIARALVRKPKILLLDDSTSALDLRTESKLIEALQKYECTILVVTNKISTAKNADLILLLDEGRIQAMGTHEELKRKSKLYHKIIQSQKDKGGFRHVDASGCKAGSARL